MERESLIKKEEIIVMKKTERWMAMLLAGVCTAGLLAGCAESGQEEETSTENVETVVIGTQEMPNDEGIAKALDYFFEEMGVEVEITQFDSGKDVNTALASGSIDFGLLGSCPAALAISQDLGVKCIWIHEILGAAESLVARADSGVTSIEELEGKTVATPFASTSHFSLLHALESAGLSETDVNLLDMQPSEIYVAWENGQIDAAYVWDPTLSELGDSVLLCTSGDLADMGYMTSNVELVRTEFMEENPELTEAYIRAVSKAVDLYQNETDEAVATIVSALELTEEDAEKQMAGSTWLSAEEQLGASYFGTNEEKGALAQNLYDTAVFLKEQDSITEVPDLSVFEEAVDSSAIEAVVE